MSLHAFNFLIISSVSVCSFPASAVADLPAPPVRVGSWVGSQRPTQTHTPLLLGLFRSDDDDCPRFLRWLRRQSTQSIVGRGGRLRVLGLAVLESDPGAALKRLRRQHPSVPIGVDAASIPKSELGQTAKQWLPLAGRLELPIAFLIGGDGRIHWYGDPTQAPNFPKWIGSRAEKQFWNGIAERAFAQKQWAAHPLKRHVDRIAKLIDDRRYDLARHEIDTLQSEPKTDWLDPVKFAPFLRLCVAEHERKVHDFYLAAREIADAHETDAPMLNQVAWKIVDPHSRIPRRDWDLAVRLARRATRLSPTNAGAYDTLGWSLYGDRQTHAAIQAERRALWFSRTSEEAYRCRNALALFQKSPR